MLGEGAGGEGHSASGRPIRLLYKCSVRLSTLRERGPGGEGAYASRYARCVFLPLSQHGRGAGGEGQHRVWTGNLFGEFNSRSFHDRDICPTFRQNIT